jgi:hypothetical protein
VNLAGVYENPVVIMQPATHNDSDPVTIRLKGITTNSFQFQLDEWDYLDGSHGTETVHYLVVEKGVHMLPGGHLLEAGSVSLYTFETNWWTKGFAAPFASEPVLVSQIQTVADSAAVVTRQRDVSASGADFSMWEQEANIHPYHTTETLGYVALAAGSGSSGSLLYDAGTTSESVTSGVYGIEFTAPFYASPRAVAGIHTFNESDAAGLRIVSSDADGIELFIEEEESSDGETLHAAEAVSYIALWSESGRIAGPIDYDGDGLPNQEDPDPLTPDTSAPVFTISYPTNSMVIP